MTALQPTDLDDMSPNALFAARSARRFAARHTCAAVRAACAPMIVLPAALLIFGCYALLVLTGVGPDSWQIRQCANGNLQARSCSAPPFTGSAARAASPSRPASTL